MFVLFGKINSIKVDSNLPGSLIRRSGHCLLSESYHCKLSEIKKKTVPPWEPSASLK